MSVWTIHPALSAPAEKTRIGASEIDRTEVNISQFEAYVKRVRLTTTAELEGGGFEYTAGWTRRPGWTWAAPYGRPGSSSEPVVHVSWMEAQEYCSSVGGRLPTFSEWRQAAYTEMRDAPTDGFIRVGLTPIRSAMHRMA